MTTSAERGRPDIASSTRTDALDLAMMAHAEGYARGRADTLAAVRAVVVDDALILAVEEHVGMGCGAWDMVKASEIIRGAIAAALDTLALRLIALLPPEAK